MSSSRGIVVDGIAYTWGFGRGGNLKVRDSAGHALFCQADHGGQRNHLGHVRTWDLEENRRLRDATARRRAGDPQVPQQNQESHSEVTPWAPNGRRRNES